MKKILIPFLVFLVTAPAAYANWEPRPFRDDGSRFIISVRAGLANPFANMQNDLGMMNVPWCIGPGGNTLVACDATYTDVAGIVNYGGLGVNAQYNEVSFAFGAAIGFALPNRSNVRLELDWLRIAESGFSANPLFSGTFSTDLGPAYMPVAGARATVTSDIVSAFVYYDFFEGNIRPTEGFIPYIGFGLGFASSQSILMLGDTYGDLSGDLSFGIFGEQQGNVFEFFTSETNNNNYALSFAIGFAYGLGDGIYFDVGARASYIPRIRFALNNAAADNPNFYRERDIFSANDIIFLTAYAGLRFEF